MANSRARPAPPYVYPLKAYPPPSRYDLARYPERYRYRVGGRRARMTIEVLDASDLTAFDGEVITLAYPLDSLPATYTTQAHTFDDDAAPPSTATDIKISGLTTRAEIAEQIALSVNTAGINTFGQGIKAWVNPLRENVVILEQQYAGYRANLVPQVFAGGLDGLLLVNGLELDAPSESDSTLYFEGGVDFIPGIIGPRRVIFPHTEVVVPDLEL
jgi:hypothetical protein